MKPVEEMTLAELRSELKAERHERELVGRGLGIDPELPQFIVTHMKMLQDELADAQAQVEGLTAEREHYRTALARAQVPKTSE